MQEEIFKKIKSYFFKIDEQDHFPNSGSIRQRKKIKNKSTVTTFWQDHRTLKTKYLRTSKAKGLSRNMTVIGTASFSTMTWNTESKRRKSSVSLEKQTQF